MEDLVRRIDDEMLTFMLESREFLNGNKAAGLRARKASLNIAKMTAEFRKESVK